MNYSKALINIFILLVIANVLGWMLIAAILDWAWFIVALMWIYHKVNVSRETYSKRKEIEEKENEYITD